MRTPYSRTLLRQYVCTVRVQLWKRTAPPEISVSVSTDIDSGMVVLTFATAVGMIPFAFSPLAPLRAIWALDLDAIAERLMAELAIAQRLDAACDDFLDSMGRMAPAWAAANDATSQAHQGQGN